MHEMSLARELVRLVDAQCEQYGYRQVLCIHLQLNVFSCAAPEALSFAFESLRSDRLAAARLEIRQAESEGCCGMCGHRAVLDKAYSACSNCAGIMLPGKEMQAGDIRITELEVI